MFACKFVFYIVHCCVLVCGMASDDPESIGTGLGALMADYIPLLPSGARRAGAARVMAARVGRDPSFLVNNPIKTQLAALGLGAVGNALTADEGGGTRLAASVLPILLTQALRRHEINSIQEDYDTLDRKRLSELDTTDMFGGSGGSSRLGAVGAYEAMRKRKYQDIGSLSEAGDAMTMATGGLSLPVTSWIDHRSADRLQKEAQAPWRQVGNLGKLMSRLATTRTDHVNDFAEALGNPDKRRYAAQLLQNLGKRDPLVFSKVHAANGDAAAKFIEKLPGDMLEGRLDGPSASLLFRGLRRAGDDTESMLHGGGYHGGLVQHASPNHNIASIYATDPAASSGQLTAVGVYKPTPNQQFFGDYGIDATLGSARKPGPTVDAYAELAHANDPSAFRTRTPADANAYETPITRARNPAQGILLSSLRNTGDSVAKFIPVSDEKSLRTLRSYMRENAPSPGGEAQHTALSKLKGIPRNSRLHRLPADAAESIISRRISRRLFGAPNEFTTYTEPMSRIGADLDKQADFADQKNSPTIPLYIAAALASVGGSAAANAWVRHEDAETEPLPHDQWSPLVRYVSGRDPLVYAQDDMGGNAFYTKPQGMPQGARTASALVAAADADGNKHSDQTKLLARLMSHGVVVADSHSSAGTLAHEAGHAKIEDTPGVLRLLQRNVYPHSQIVAPLAGVGSMAAGLASGSMLNGALLGTGIGLVSGLGTIAPEAAASYYGLKGLQDYKGGALSSGQTSPLVAALSTYLAAGVLPSTLAGAAGGWVSGRRRKKETEALK